MQLSELALAPHEHGAGRNAQRARERAGGWRLQRGGGRRRERGVLREDRALELAQVLARLDPELADQGGAGVAIGLQRIGLTARPVQRDHQLAAEALAVRVLGDQRVEPADRLLVSAQRQLGLDQPLERRDAQIGEASGVGGDERLMCDVGQRLAAPSASACSSWGTPPSRNRRSKRHASIRSGSTES